MTSNLASAALLSAKGSKRSGARSTSPFRAAFRPEFLNRIDDVIIFQALTREEIAKIVDIQFARVAGILAERHVAVEMTPAARMHLAEVGFDPDFGARPLKRALQREVMDPLALKLLSGEIKPADSVVIDARGGTLVFDRREAVAQPEEHSLRKKDASARSKDATARA